MSSIHKAFSSNPFGIETLHRKLQERVDTPPSHRTRLGLKLVHDDTNDTLTFTFSSNPFGIETQHRRCGHPMPSQLLIEPVWD